MSVGFAARTALGPSRDDIQADLAPIRTPQVARSRKAADGRPIDVLVLDAEYRQALAAMRSLARSGMKVGSVVCASDENEALAFRSRWCRLRAVVPDFAQDATGYADAIIALLDQHPADLILPCHDGSIAALRARRSELEQRTALPLASEAALNIAVNKERTLSLAKNLGIAVPRTVALSDTRDLRAALDHIGYPAVIKPAWSWAQRDGVGTRLSCAAVSDLGEGQRVVDAIRMAGGRAVIQQWLSGRREAVSLFYAANKFWARFVQMSYRELPSLGGASVLCESTPPLPELIAPAQRLDFEFPADPFAP